MRPEGIKQGRKTSWVALVALFLVPLLVVGTLIGLTGRHDEKKITAAIVNLDEGTKVDGKTVPMGRQLSAEIMEREGENINWILADDVSAADGLRTGEYAAVVTIGKDFSERVMSFTKNDADVAEKARVQVTVSRNAPAWDAGLAQEIARIATQSLNKMLTTQYLDGIYVGFNEVGGQFQQIVDGASELKEGTAKLSDGVGKAAEGTSKFDDGMGKLVEGGKPLNAGGKQLVDGVDQMTKKMPQLVDGVGQLATGANQLLPGVKQYTDGTAQLVGGIGQLSDGLDQVVSGLDSAEMDLSQLQQLVDGSAELATGADQLADGIDQVVAPLEQLDGLITDDMVQQAKLVQQQLSKLGTSVSGLDKQLQGFASGAVAPPKEVTDAAALLKAQFECTEQDPTVCAGQRAAYEAGVDAAVRGGFQQGARRASELLRTPDPQTGKSYLELAEAIGAQDGQGLDKIVDGLGKAQQLVPGLKRLQQGSRQLADGNQQLADGIEQLATVMPKKIDEQMGQLKAGLGKLRDGAQLMERKAQPLVAGGTKLGEGATKLNSGIQQLASQVGALPEGVRQLRGGLLQYVDGVWKYTDGVAEAANGADELADGMGKLDEGASKLDDGVGEFSQKLADGKSQLPNYSEADRETLGDVVSSPVQPDESLMARGGVPLSALILVAGLWLAALAAFTIARPVPSDVVMARAPSALLWLRTVGLPTMIVALAGAALGIVGGVWWHMSVGRTLGLVAILAGLGVVFSFAHHALTGWLGHVGRGLSLLLLAVSIALGLSSSVPGWLGAVAVASPLQSGMLLTRSWLAGAPVVTSLAAMVLVALVLGAVSLLAIALRRRLTPSQFTLRYT